MCFKPNAGVLPALLACSLVPLYAPSLLLPSCFPLALQNEVCSAAGCCRIPPSVHSSPKPMLHLLYLPNHANTRAWRGSVLWSFKLHCIVPCLHGSALPPCGALAPPAISGMPGFGFLAATPLLLLPDAPDLGMIFQATM